MFCPIADSQTAAEIDAADGNPERAQFDNEVCDPGKGAPIRIEIDEL